MTATPFKRRVVRASKPFWPYAPTSGEGAARHGGRFNPKGVPALCTSFDFETCAQEVLLSLNADPYTFYHLEVESAKTADLSSRTVREELGIKWSDLECPNWELKMNQGEEPASHTIAKRLIGMGYHGIIVPSFAQRATPDNLNLVLWNWKLATERNDSPYDCAWVTVMRPEMLPQNQPFWKRRA